MEQSAITILKYWWANLCANSIGDKGCHYLSQANWP